MGAAPCIAKDKSGEVNDLKELTAKQQKEIAELKKQNLYAGPSDAAIDSAAWLNTIIAELWPKISAFVTATIKEQVQPQIQEKLPKALASTFYFEDVTLGHTPLQFGSIKSAGEDYLGRNGKTRDVAIQFDIVYKGNAVVKLSALAVKCGIQNIRMHGILSIVLKELLDKPPFVSGLSVFFANPPRITMEWSGLTGTLNLGPIKHAVRDIVRQQVSNVCVLPKRIAVVLDKSEPRLFRIKAPRPPGCIHLELLSARNLEGKDYSLNPVKVLKGQMTSDPYVKFRLGSQEYKSKTIAKTVNPTYNEKIDFVVFDKSMMLSLDVFDEDFGSGDDFLGRIEMTVGEIIDKCNGRPTWFPLGPDVDEDNDKQTVEGEVQVVATWMPVTLDQAKAQAIKASEEKPQCLMFLGLYSIDIPPEKVGTSYEIEISCNGKSTKLTKALSAVSVDPATVKVQTDEMKAKIAKLRELKAEDADIAMILSIPEEALKEADPAAIQYSNTIMVEEPFLWITDAPGTTSVDIVVSKGNTRIGSVKYEAARLTKIETCTERDTIGDAMIKCDVLAQVRVIGD